MTIYYAAPIGTHGSGTLLDPWGIPDIAVGGVRGVACTTLLAGDTLNFRGGTYNIGGVNVPSGDQFQVIGPTHSGTALLPITMQSYPGEVAHFVVPQGTNQPLFGTINGAISYCRFLRLWITVNNDPAGILVAMGMRFSGTGNEIGYCLIQGTPWTGDNYAGIHLFQAFGTRVHHCEISGWTGTSVHSYGMYITEGGTNTIEDMYFHDNEINFLDKSGGASGQQITLRRCLLTNTDPTFFSFGSPVNGTGGTTFHVYDNVISGHIGAGQHHQDSEFYNNLIYADRPFVSSQPGNVILNVDSTSATTIRMNFWNNIATASTTNIMPIVNPVLNFSHGTGATDPINYFDFNVYTKPPIYKFQDGTKTLAQLQAAGLELSESTVSALTDVYVDLTSYVLKPAFQAAGRFGDAVGPRFSIPTILDTTRYGPNAWSGTNYYVAPNATTGGGTLEDPWGIPDLAVGGVPKIACTILRAGDTLNFRGGEYAIGGVNVPSGEDFPVITPTHSGTSTQPITLQAYPTELPHFTVPAGTNQPLFGTINGALSYIRFIGLSWTVNNNLSDAHVSGGMRLSGTGNEIAYCKIVGSPWLGTDNYAGIDALTSYNTWIHHNEISGWTTVGQHGVGILLYKNGITTIEDNWIHDNEIGTVQKDGGVVGVVPPGFNQGTFRRNWYQNSNPLYYSFGGPVQGVVSKMSVYDNWIDGYISYGILNADSEFYNNIIRCENPHILVEGSNQTALRAVTGSATQVRINVWNNVVTGTTTNLTSVNNPNLPLSVGSGATDPITYFDYNVYLKPTVYTFQDGTRTLAQIHSAGLETHASQVAALTNVYVDLTGWVLKSPYNTAGRFGDNVGPRVSVALPLGVATILDASRYGPQAIIPPPPPPSNAAGASKMGKNRLLDLGTYVVWSRMNAGSPGPIVASPCHSRPLLSFQQGFVIWSDAFRFGTLVPPPATFQYFEQALEAKLLSVTNLATLCSDSIYTQALPQTHDLRVDGPALSYSVPTKPYGHVLTGSDRTATARVQFDAWSYSYGTAKQMLEAVRDSIDGPPGIWGDGSCEIVWVVQQDDIDASERPQAGSDQWLYHLISEYSVMYRQPAPTLA